ncbi:hypothetical protein G6O67_004113 [Ophiocordyceps sinensis]|uniref:Pantetheine-phosphate adenylyltransferase family protein n=1 Tax=Ophiocordyceps sinensis TaxID=72228 RepID=A0A8H4LZR0_9HYPO|nr:hypothetical protein G6O67_004113 [Ophiocordyceps sinensis]
MATDSLPPSLLLLPAPPRPATHRLIDAAYRAPLTAVLTRLSREHARQSGPGPTPVLVVAVGGSSILATGSSSEKPEPEPETETETETETSARARCKSSSVRWKPAQSLLASLYAIIASICAERDIAAHLGSHEPGTVDARVVLVHRNAHATPSAPSVQPGSSCRYGAHHAASNSTAVLDLATFAARVRPWKVVFHPSSDAGRELLAAYLAHAEGGQQLPQSQICEVDSGTTFSSPRLPDVGGVAAQETRGLQHEQGQGRDSVGGYSTVCLGGTFDHLHPGHKLLLEAAVLLLAVPDGGAEPCTLIIGISGDELLTKKEYASELQPWEARAGSVIAFLSTALGSGPTTTAARVTRVPAASHGGPSAAPEIRARLRDRAVLVRCVDIGDPFGPTVTEERIGAIVVSGETRGGAEAINEKRAARGWAPLDVYEIDVLDDATGDGQARLTEKISSTEIRRRKALGPRCQDGERGQGAR